VRLTIQIPAGTAGLSAASVQALRAQMSWLCGRTSTTGGALWNRCCSPTSECFMHPSFGSSEKRNDLINIITSPRFVEHAMSWRLADSSRSRRQHQKCYWTISRAERSEEKGDLCDGCGNASSVSISRRCLHAEPSLVTASAIACCCSASDSPGQPTLEKQ